MRTERARMALYRRCRQGDPEALAALLYSVCDELYSLARLVSDAEDVAAGLVAQWWRDTLGLLGRWHVGGHIQARARAIGLAGVRRRCGLGVARWARQQVVAWETDGLPHQLPEPVGRELELELPGHAQVIQQAGQRRAQLMRRLGTAAALALALAIPVSWQYPARWLTTPPAEVRFEGLRARVTRANMPAVVRELLDELADSDAGQADARALQRIGLALEEIANAPDLQSLAGFRYIGERIRRESLAWYAADLAERYQGALRLQLFAIALVLEEVANT